MKECEGILDSILNMYDTTGGRPGISMEED